MGFLFPLLFSGFFFALIFLCTALRGRLLNYMLRGQTGDYDHMYTLDPILDLAKGVPNTAQVSFLVSAPTHLSFSHPAAYIVYLSTHEHACLKTRCGQAHCCHIVVLRQQNAIARWTNKTHVHNTSTHRDMQQPTNMLKIKNKLTIWKINILSLVKSCFHFAHKQICFLFPSTWQGLHYNNNPPKCFKNAPRFLKGTGDDILSGLLHVTP